MDYIETVITFLAGGTLALVAYNRGYKQGELKGYALKSKKLKEEN